MYNKGHKISLQLLGVVLGIIAPFFVFSAPTSATTEECAFSSSFSRNTKNRCAYMEQWPIQKILKKDIEVQVTLNFNLTKSVMTSQYLSETSNKIGNALRAERISAGWTQGAAKTKDYFVISLFSAERSHNYIAILNQNYQMIKLLKEPSKGAWGHIHSIWNNPSSNFIRVDAAHGASTSADANDKCYDVGRIVENNDDFIVNAASQSIACNSSVVPAYRSVSKDGLVYQGDAILNSKGKSYNYTLLWDAGEVSWLEKAEWNKGIKKQCVSNDKNCIYQHDSEGMHYKRHNKIIAIKDQSDGKIVKVLYISKKTLDGEPEGISFDKNGNLYLTVIKKDQYGDPNVKVVKIAKEVHAPSANLSVELKNWFSINAATMAQHAIKIAEEVIDEQTSILICNTNNLSDSDHRFCVNNIYNSIKKAIQGGTPETIPNIRENTTRKLFNEAVTKFKTSKYIKAILSNIKSTKIAAVTIESFKKEAIFKVLSEMLTEGGENAKRAVKYFNKVSDDFAKELAIVLEQKYGTFHLIREHSWTDKDKLKKVSQAAGLSMRTTALFAVNTKAPAATLAKAVTSELDTESSSEGDDYDSDSSDDDIEINIGEDKNDDEKAETIEDEDWQDALIEQNDGDEDYSQEVDYGVVSSVDGGNEGEVSVPGTSHTSTPAPQPDICSSADAPDAVKRASGCTMPGEEGLESNVANIINAIIGILGLVAVVGIIYGGVQYMTSQADPGKTKAAKNAIIYSAIGLIIVILSAVIVNWVVGIF